MDILDKKDYYNNLFDYYGELLTLKQQEYFQDYNFGDLSLAEVASLHDVSRNAIYDQLIKIYALLDEYEDKLQLYAKHLQRENIYREYSANASNDVLEMIKKLRSLE